MITPKGFVLLGSKSGGMRAGAHTKHTKANQPAGPLARASGACRAVVFCRASCSGLWLMVPCRAVVFRGVVFCGVASLSSVDLSLLLWTAAGSCTGCYTQAWCTHTHKLGAHTHTSLVHTHTSLVHTHTSLRRKDIRSQGSHWHHTGTGKISTRKHHGGSGMLGSLGRGGNKQPINKQ